MLSALEALPDYQGTVYRGVKLNLSAKYQRGHDGIWCVPIPTSNGDVSIDAAGILHQVHQRILKSSSLHTSWVKWGREPYLPVKSSLARLCHKCEGCKLFGDIPGTWLSHLSALSTHTGHLSDILTGRGRSPADARLPLQCVNHYPTLCGSLYFTINS